MKKILLGAALLLPIVFAACSKHEHGAMGPEAKVSKYHCPMHPTYIKDGPGECAICGMTLVPIEEAGADHGEADAAPDGLATVKVDPRRRQLIGLKLGKTQMGPMVRVIRTVGRIAQDPELYRTQEEFLTAISSYKGIQGSSSVEVVQRSKALLDSSRLRLRILGLSEGQIDALAKKGSSDRGLLLAQGRGSKPWMYADLYENDLELVRVGQEVEAASKALPGETFSGEIGSIDSTVNPKTRTVRVRVRLSDPKGLLRPDTYLNARIHADLGMRVSIPDTAVIDTGVRQVVFVDAGEGHLEPREVRLGVRAENRVEVLEGLEEDDAVVTSGNFLIDSESRLKAVVMGMSSKGSGGAAPDPHAGHGGR